MNLSRRKPIRRTRLKGESAETSKAKDGLREREESVAYISPGLSVSPVTGTMVRVNVSGDRSPQDATGETTCESRVFYDGVPETP